MKLISSTPTVSSVNVSTEVDVHAVMQQLLKDLSGREVRIWLQSSFQEAKPVVVRTKSFYSKLCHTRLNFVTVIFVCKFAEMIKLMVV